MNKIFRWIIKILRAIFGLKGRHMMPAIILDPNSFSPHPTDTPALVTEAGGSPTYKYLAFDDSTDEMAYWNFWMDSFYDSGTITFDLFWKAAATSGDVVWRVGTRGYIEGEDWPAVSTATGNVTDTTQGTTEYLNKATISISTTNISPSDMVMLGITRKTGGADTMTGDAKLLYIVMRYNVAG